MLVLHAVYFEPPVNSKLSRIFIFQNFPKP